jgi:hypothetical protein
MLRQLGPYYCFIILFNIYMCIIIDLFLKDNYYLLVKMNYLLNDNIKWPKMWLGRDFVLITWYFINSKAILYLARLHTDNLNPLLKEAFELSKSLDSQGVSNL